MYRAPMLLTFSAMAALGWGCTESTIYAPNPEPPVAVALLQAQDAMGELVTQNYTQQAFGTEVQLDGTESYDPDHADYDYTFLEYEWSFVRTPAGSVAELSYPHLLPESEEADGARPVFTADVTGTYRLELVVRNPEEELTSEPDLVSMQATAWEDLQIDMYWTVPATDIDLHLLGPDGEYWGDGDCFFANPNPDWGMEGSAVDDPLYEEDDDNGGDANNPAHEKIELQRPAEGIYSVIVTYHSDRETDQLASPWIETTMANVELHPAVEAPQDLAEGEAWVVMEIEMPEMEVTVLDEITTHEDLGGPPVND